MLNNLPIDAIVDTSNPRVIHIIYPSGLQLTKEQLDPNIGNFFDPKDSHKRNKPKDNPDQDIWATQISFE